MTDLVREVIAHHRFDWSDPDRNGVSYDRQGQEIEIVSVYEYETEVGRVSDLAARIDSDIWAGFDGFLPPRIYVRSDRPLSYELVEATLDYQESAGDAATLAEARREQADLEARDPNTWTADERARWDDLQVEIPQLEADTDAIWCEIHVTRNTAAGITVLASARWQHR